MPYANVSIESSGISQPFGHLSDETEVSTATETERWLTHREYLFLSAVKCCSVPLKFLMNKICHSL